MTSHRAHRLSRFRLQMLSPAAWADQAILTATGTNLQVHVSLCTTLYQRPPLPWVTCDRPAWLPFPGLWKRLPAAWPGRAASAACWSRKGLRLRPVTGRWLGVDGCGAANPREGRPSSCYPGQRLQFLVSLWISSRCLSQAFTPSSEFLRWGPSGRGGETWVSFQPTPLIGSLTLGRIRPFMGFRLLI